MDNHFPSGRIDGRIGGRIDGQRRSNPAESTNKEAEYIEWLSRNKVPVVVKLLDDEDLRGWIEYYDRDIIRLTRDSGSNLFIYKNRVKYLFEDPDHAPRRR